MHLSTRIRAIVGVALTALALGACSSNQPAPASSPEASAMSDASQTRTVTDASGQEVTLPSHPSRVVTIDAGDLGAREAELTDVDSVVALLRAVCDEAGAGPVMVAGQSYGGLAVLEAALRSDLPLDCAVAQSPSLWWGGEQRGVGEGTLMGDLRAGSVRPRGDVQLRLQVGTLEQTMRPVVDSCAELVRGLGVPVDVDHYRSGHDVAWWREGIVRSLDGWCAITY